MARIFLSYAREDLGKAERLAQALAAAGHAVWWDRHLHAGARFTAEIDEQLKKAERVVVLWTRQSVESAWVQDEAAAGRDSGRLVPVLLEAVTPPLGFRQYQALDLSRWSGRGQPRALKELIAALGEPTAPAPPDSVVAAKPAPQRRLWPIGVVLALLAILGASFVWLRLGGEPAKSVIIAPSPAGDAAARDFAHQVALDLTRFKPATLAAMTISEDAAAVGNASYRALIGFQQAATGPEADISLIVARRGGVAWAQKIAGKAGHLADLRQQGASTLANVLGCALVADASSAKLGDPDFHLFLDACAKFGASSLSFSSGDVVPLFKKITASAPRFAAAHAMLALAQYYSAFGMPESEAIALMRSARASLARAKQLDPDLEEGFAADSLLHPFNAGQWAHAFPVLDRGLARYPNSSLLLGLRADRLLMVGRNNEAAGISRQALGFDPLSPQVRVNFINALAFSNRIAEAHAELAKAEAIWPSSATLGDARFRVDMRYGDAAAALAQFKAGSANIERLPFDQSWEKFLAARIDSSPANIEAALQSFRERYRRDAADVPGYLQALGTFGRTDEAFQITASPVSVDSLQTSTDILFRPHMCSLHIDPRFMRLVASLGMVAYWKTSGVWPDFCKDPQLPYECRSEAAKYR